VFENLHINQQESGSMIGQQLFSSMRRHGSEEAITTN